MHQPVNLRVAEESGLRRLGWLVVAGVGAAVAAHVDHENFEQRAVVELAVDALAFVCRIWTQRRVFEKRFGRSRRQQRHVFLGVTCVGAEVFAVAPVVGDFMVVPLPQLRHLLGKLTDIGIPQVVAVTTAKFVLRLGDFLHALGDQVVPDLAAFDIDGGGHRAVGINRVAAMHKKVRVAQPHLLIDAHAAEVGVDAEVLAGRIAAPYEARAAPRIERRRAELCHQPFAARAAGAQVFHRHAGKNLLAQRQFGQVHAGGEVGRLQRIRADDPARVGKAITGVPFEHHARRLVAARPDDAARIQATATGAARIVAIPVVVLVKAAATSRHDGGVAKLQAVRQVRPDALRGDQRRRA